VVVNIKGTLGNRWIWYLGEPHNNEWLSKMSDRDDKPSVPSWPGVLAVQVRTEYVLN